MILECAAGYIVLFIGGAFLWGNLLASVSEIHASASAREREKLEEVLCRLGLGGVGKGARGKG